MSADVRNQVETALEEAHLMSLGTVDADGVWVSDVTFVYDDHLNIYWISHPEARHSQAILREPSVAASVTAREGREKALAVQLSGRAEVKDAEQPDLERKLKEKRGLPAPHDATGPLISYYCWYKLVPEHVELLDYALFGYEKQTLALE